MNISAQEIINICNGILICGNDNTIIKKYSIDTRTIATGDMYIAIKGDNIDGNNYIKEAFKKGAIGCITDSKEIADSLVLYSDKIIIQVDNTILAMQKIATYIRSKINIPVIAITGSVGKTSTKDIIANIVSQKYNVLKTEGNLNNHIGLPLTLLNLEDQNAIVVEMGMNHLGEISTLSKIAKPNIAVITNIGTSHIGNLGSRENILKAKLEILDGLEKNGKLIINNDNDLLHNWYEKNNNLNVITYGIENQSEYIATNISQNNFFSTFNIEGKNIQVNVSGFHFIYNSLAAYAIGKLLEIDDNKIMEGISSFQLTEKRMEIRKISNDSLLIEDYYNASPESVAMALDALSKLNVSKKIAVLGDVLELGDFSEKLHKQIGLEVAKNNIDVLITVGDNAKHIATEAQNNGLKNIYICSNNQEAISFLKQEITENSATLIKASHGMNFGEIAKEIN